MLSWRIKILILFLKYRTDPKPNIYRMHSNKPLFLTSFHRKWCRRTTEKTESHPSLVMQSNASLRWWGCRHGDVAWMLQMTPTPVQEHNINSNHSAFVVPFVAIYLERVDFCAPPTTIYYTVKLTGSFWVKMFHTITKKQQVMHWMKCEMFK